MDCRGRRSMMRPTQVQIGGAHQPIIILRLNKEQSKKGYTVRNLSTTPATSFTNRSNVISLRWRVWSLICIWRSHDSYPGHCDATTFLAGK